MAFDYRELIDPVFFSRLESIELRARSIVEGTMHGLHRSPHHVLGPHSHECHVTVRTLRPGAQSVSMLLADGRELPMTHETGGIWAAVVQQKQVPTYRLAVTREGERRVVDESYRHEPLLGETDLHLLG